MLIRVLAATLVLAAATSWATTLDITGTAHIGGFQEFTIDGPDLSIHSDQGQTAIFPIVCLVGTPCKINHEIPVSHLSDVGSASVVYKGNEFFSPFLSGRLFWRQRESVLITRDEVSSGESFRITVPVSIVGNVRAFNAEDDTLAEWRFRGMGTLILFALGVSRESVGFTGDAEFSGLLEATPVAQEAPEPATAGLAAVAGLAFLGLWRGRRSFS